MSKSIPLSPSQEKIKRAQAKFEYLKSIINRYISSNPCSLRIEHYGDISHIVARREKDVPEEIGFEVVEAVGHLRSALDKLAVALVDKNGRGTSGVGFPFGAIDNGKPIIIPNPRTAHIEKKFTPDQWKLIVAQRPYPGGNETLWAINQIANSDKHGLELVGVKPRDSSIRGLGVAGTHFGAEVLIANPPQQETWPYDYEREKVLVFIKRGVGNLGIEAQPPSEIIFDEIAPVTGMNVLTTLNQQIRITESIVKTFKSAFF